MSLRVSERFQPTFRALQRSLPQSILLYGDKGVGLTSIAKAIAGRGAEIIQPVQSKTSTTLSITVDTIRDLYVQTRGKNARHVIVIDDAHRMTLPAQHAFLKLLEEPNQYIHFILVSAHPDKLLLTVRSRTQQYYIPGLNKAEFLSFLKTLETDETKRRQIMFVASGRPALASRLLSDSKQLETLAGVMRDAQEFVGSDRYKAVQVALNYAATNQKALALVQAGIQILHHTAHTKPSADVIARLDTLTDIYVNLSRNAQARLQLLSYVVQ